MCVILVQPQENAMHFIDRYPIIVTAAFAACGDFWVQHLGFNVIFENDWFVYLQADGASIAFMSAAHPATPGVIPAQAGIQKTTPTGARQNCIPAYAGMTLGKGREIIGP